MPLGRPFLITAIYKVVIYDKLNSVYDLISQLQRDLFVGPHSG
jgi:hypothetical protein